MSTPQSNSTVNTDSPVVDSDRTRNTPGVPFIRLSSGKVIIRSTSSAAIPGQEVMMFTSGAFKSG